jgi:hypothetical protein
MNSDMNTSAIIRLTGPAEDVNALIVLAVTSGLCESCEMSGPVAVPRARPKPVVLFTVGDRVASKGLSSAHKLVAGQQGTVCHVRDMGNRGTSLNIEWDDGVDRGGVGSAHIVPLPSAPESS